MATTSSMFLYSLTVSPPTAITQAILGQFAGTKEQQIITASGSRLALHRPDPVQGKISAVFSNDVFGIIRTLAAFRLAGSNKGESDSTGFTIHLVIARLPPVARRTLDSLCRNSPSPGRWWAVMREELR